MKNFKNLVYLLCFLCMAGLYWNLAVQSDASFTPAAFVAVLSVLTMRWSAERAHKLSLKGSSPKYVLAVTGLVVLAVACTASGLTATAEFAGLSSHPEWHLASWDDFGTWTAQAKLLASL